MSYVDKKTAVLDATSELQRKEAIKNKIVDTVTLVARATMQTYVPACRQAGTRSSERLLHQSVEKVLLLAVRALGHDPLESAVRLRKGLYPLWSTASREGAVAYCSGASYMSVGHCRVHLRIVGRLGGAAAQGGGRLALTPAVRSPHDSVPLPRSGDRD